MAGWTFRPRIAIAVAVLLLAVLAVEFWWLMPTARLALDVTRDLKGIAGHLAAVGLRLTMALCLDKLLSRSIVDHRGLGGRRRQRP